MQRFHVSIGFDISVVVASYGSGTYHPFDFVVSSYLTKSAISSGRLVPTRDKINCISRHVKLPLALVQVFNKCPKNLILQS